MTWAPRIGFLLPLSLASFLVAQTITEPPFESDIRKFEAEDVVHPPTAGGIVFVGSSSIVRWKTLAKDFPEYNVINRGFGGSEIADSVRYVDRIVTPYKPVMVVFFAGTNDIAAGKSAQTVLNDYREFVTKVHAKLPKTDIAYLSISPAPSRWDKLETMKEANLLIQEYANSREHLIFVNLYLLMVTDKGGPRPELFVEDQLHLSPLGYEIWAREVRKILPKHLGRKERFLNGNS